MQKDGIFLIDKPSGKTSHQVIQELKRKLGINKIGHAGTLDPLATGLLVVLVNSATKLSDYLLTSDKGYSVEMQLFTQTNSGDITGEVIKTITPYNLSKREIKKVFGFFNGFMYDQYPPMYSAVKVKGKKLYEYARSQQEIEVKPRSVTIKKISQVNYNKKKHTISFNVLCSKGTYVRSLVEDIAEKLGTVATVSALRRVSCGEFLINHAIDMEKVSWSNLLSIYDALLKNKKMLITHHNEKEIKQGKLITIIKHTEPIIFIINKQKEVLAIYEHIGKHIYKCKRGLWTIDPEHEKNLTLAEREE